MANAPPQTRGSIGSQLSIMECRAVTVVEASGTAPLADMLTGLAGKEGTPVRTHEVVMRTGMRDRAAGGELHMLRDLPTSDTPPPTPWTHPGPHRWRVRQEALPVRGKGAADLPATVRSVAEFAFTGGDARAFWSTLGFGLHHEVVKEGFQWTLQQGEHCVEVKLVQLLRLTQQGIPESAVPLSPLHSLLEVTARGTDATYGSAAQAVGTIGDTLAPLATLQRP